MAESAGLGRASRFASSGGPKPKLSVSVHCRCGGVPSSLLRFSIFLQFLRREWFGWLLGSLGVPTGGFGCCLCSGMLAGLATMKYRRFVHASVTVRPFAVAVVGVLSGSVRRIRQISGIAGIGNIAGIGASAKSAIWWNRRNWRNRQSRRNRQNFDGTARSNKWFGGSAEPAVRRNRRAGWRTRGLADGRRTDGRTDGRWTDARTDARTKKIRNV